MALPKNTLVQSLESMTTALFKKKKVFTDMKKLTILR